MRRFNALGYYLRSIFLMLMRIKNWPVLLSVFMRKPNGSRAYMLRLRQPPVRVWVRGAMDTWSVKETFLDAFYTRYGVAVQNGWNVIDIGAGVGDFAIYAAWSRPETVVWAFEPFPASFQLLEKNLSENAITNVNIFQMAVWRSEGELILDLSSGEPLQITSIEAQTVIEHSDWVPVPAITLEALLEQHHLERVDLLKLDCEGAEYEILMNSPASVLSKIKRIVMEYHDLDENANYQVLMTFLEDQGYLVRRQKNLVHDVIGYLYAERKPLTKSM